MIRSGPFPFFVVDTPWPTPSPLDTLVANVLDSLRQLERQLNADRDAERLKENYEKSNFVCVGWRCRGPDLGNDFLDGFAMAQPGF